MAKRLEGRDSESSRSRGRKYFEDSAHAYFFSDRQGIDPVLQDPADQQYLEHPEGKSEDDQ
jgi:hypothetical protein